MAAGGIAADASRANDSQIPATLALARTLAIGQPAQPPLELPHKTVG